MRTGERNGNLSILQAELLSRFSFDGSQTWNRTKGHKEVKMKMHDHMARVCLSIVAGATLLHGQAQPSRTSRTSDGRRSQAVNSDSAPKLENHAAVSARRITLEEAKQQAGAQGNPMARLGELQVEAAKQHRLGAQSDFFPKIGTTLLNTHFNKFMGQQITVQRPIRGGTAALAVPLIGKDQTLVAATAAQPITPLFKLRQVYNLARADENIARAKAGMPVSSSASQVEKNYYELLIAQSQLALAQANANRLESKVLLAGNSLQPDGHDPDVVEIAQALAEATTRVKELSASLNERLGWPLDTELELVPPALPLKEISLQEATDKAMAANAEVVEAEQNVAKARAASSLAKLDYVPDIVVTGGYAYQVNAIPLLPRDFSYIGIIGAYTLYDFGKREHTIKERKAQVGMAETALQLTKAKVAAGVKHSYFALERARQMSEVTHRLASSTQLQKTSFGQDSAQIRAARARVEAEMYQSDLDYCQALAELKTLMGER